MPFPTLCVTDSWLSSSQCTFVMVLCSTNEFLTSCYTGTWNIPHHKDISKADHLMKVYVHLVTTGRSSRSSTCSAVNTHTHSWLGGVLASSDLAMASSSPDKVARKTGEGYDKPNAEQELPIDVNYQKLAEWLVSGPACVHTFNTGLNNQYHETNP